MAGTRCTASLTLLVALLLPGRTGSSPQAVCSPHGALGHPRHRAAALLSLRAERASSPAAELVAGDPGDGRVLVVVRTWHQNYDTRIQGIMDTWGGDLYKAMPDALVIVGNKARSSSPPIIPAEGCGNDHSRELTCRTGFALQAAYHRLANFSWVFVLDDDVYMNFTNVQKSLSKFDPAEPMGLGVWGCGPGFCSDDQGGFCGGGGYALSRAFMKEIMQPSPASFQEDLMSNLAMEPSGQVYDDVSMGCMVKRRGAKVEGLPGLHPYRLEGEPTTNGLNSEYGERIQQSSPRPLTFHYIGVEEMAALYKEFQHLKFNNSRLFRADDGAALAKYDAEVRRFVAEWNARMRELGRL